ncbi:hypothetical protein LF65_04372 [Clostridium beijerinckii]|uniref:Methyl-accepting chemotaxis protein n=1 Tax=Clostridium beijerinckii TaxID=1520 RepID=A0A0B5QRP0_CLOBE|nr:HAMP domain-containing methyl-accepting chemotaxis protein [Clostridium beijerinckii]AJH00912.1 hypothetical protein LF65_04372 [Clostridium beijerinckii]
MNLLRNAKVKSKILFMGSIALIFLVIVGFIGLYYIKRSNDKMKVMNSNLLAVEYIEEVKYAYNSLNTDLFKLMATSDVLAKNELKESINNKKDALNQYVKEYANTKLDPFEIDTLKQFKDNSESAEKAENDVLSLALANKNEEAYALYKKNLSALNQKIEKNIIDLTKYKVNSTDQLDKENQANYIKSTYIVVGVVLLALLIVLIVSIFITNLIAKPIQSLERYIEMVALGDLREETLEKTREVKLYNDEIGKLGYSIIYMRQKLWQLVSKVCEVSEQIAASSQEFNANSENSYKGIEETARSVNTIAEGIEIQFNTVMDTSNVIKQMSIRIKQVAKNTIDAAKVAEKTLKVTNEGGKDISIAKNQMNNIEEVVTKLDDVIKILVRRSNEIGQIVEVISGIAEQTNLLALNAAIEAARAGEEGRGFTVVAEEVRKLAERSKQLTGKISALIGQIQDDTANAVSAMYEGTKQVKIGMEVVENVGQSFDDISKLVLEITNQMREAAIASESITSGNQQVVSYMEKVDEISKDTSSQSQAIASNVEEQTAAMQEITSASEELTKIGEILMTEILKFKL